MVCYICGKPASAKCPDCRRCICTDHTLRDQIAPSVFGQIHCPECPSGQERVLARYKAGKERLIQVSGDRKCEFCGTNDVNRYCEPTGHFFSDDVPSDDTGWTNRRCGVCGKYFCSNCGTITTLRGTRLDRPSDDTFTWRRCHQHKQKYRSRFERGPLAALLPLSDTDPDDWEPPDDHR